MNKYKIYQVDKYIKELLNKNDKRRSELSRQIEKLDREKKQLELLSIRIKRDSTVYSAENLPVDLYVEMLKTMYRHKQNCPTKANNKKAGNKLAVNKTLDGSVDIIKQDIETLAGKLDNLAVMIENRNAVNSNNVEISISESSNSRRDMPTVVAISEVTENNSTVNEKDKIEAVDFKNEAVKSKKPEITVPANNMGKLLNFSRINTKNIVKKEVIREEKSSFWGIAVNEYQKSDMVSLGIDTHEILEYVNKTDDTVPINSFFDNTSNADKVQKVVRKEFYVKDEMAAAIESEKSIFSILQQKDKGTPEKDMSGKENEIHKHVETEVDEDARFIRQKYIIGKIAGTDLFDRNGKLIIGLNDKITSQVIEYADREGKLPELIVNMILPDME
ncbi:MAG: hypothetical protein PHF63_05275 [Herbinix sp.]|nr:hypothetical protein [Herbinix sp.]